MQTEAIDPQYQSLDRWPLARSLAALVNSNMEAVKAVANALPSLEAAAVGIKDRLEHGGRLIYIGAGTSGRLAAQDAAELLPTFGFERAITLLAGGANALDRAQENAEDDELEALNMVTEAAIGPRDAAIGIAASGKTAFTLSGVRCAKERGAFTVGIANNAGTPLLELPHVAVLLETGPEVLAGSTRLAAGTAQKVALNALSTAVLVRLGGAYDNLMVGMKPSNDKLRWRAVNIVSLASGHSETEARQALEEVGGNIREAIVMLQTGCSLAQAQRSLHTHHNRVREAIEQVNKLETP